VTVFGSSPKRLSRRLSPPRQRPNDKVLFYLPVTKRWLRQTVLSLLRTDNRSSQIARAHLLTLTDSLPHYLQEQLIELPSDLFEHLDQVRIEMTGRFLGYYPYDIFLRELGFVDPA
jgi:hypothetical protein